MCIAILLPMLTCWPVRPDRRTKPQSLSHLCWRGSWRQIVVSRNLEKVAGRLTPPGQRRNHKSPDVRSFIITAIQASSVQSPKKLRLPVATACEEPGGRAGSPAVNVLLSIAVFVGRKQGGSRRDAHSCLRLAQFRYDFFRPKSLYLHECSQVILCSWPRPKGSGQCAHSDACPCGVPPAKLTCRNISLLRHRPMDNLLKIQIQAQRTRCGICPILWMRLRSRKSGRTRPKIRPDCGLLSVNWNARRNRSRKGALTIGKVYDLGCDKTFAAFQMRFQSWWMLRSIAADIVYLTNPPIKR